MYYPDKDFAELTGKPHDTNQEATAGFTDMEVFHLTLIKFLLWAASLYMRNSKDEAEKLRNETYHHKNTADYVVMDSEVADCDLCRKLKRQGNILLITRCRKNMNKSPERRKMIEIMEQSAHKVLFRQRGFTVEPVQGLVKNIFNPDNCLMRGEKNNRRLLAATRVAVQLSRLAAYRKNRSV